MQALQVFLGDFAIWRAKGVARVAEWGSGGGREGGGGGGEAGRWTAGLNV